MGDEPGDKKKKNSTNPDLPSVEGQKLIATTTIELSTKANGVNGSLTAFRYVGKLILHLTTDDREYLEGETNTSETCEEDDLTEYFDRIKKGIEVHYEIKNNKKLILSKGEKTILKPRNLSESTREIKDLKAEIRDLRKEINMLKSIVILHETKSNGNNACGPTPAANTWIKRQLNVIQYSGLDIKLEDGSFTLPEGKYYIRAAACSGWAGVSRVRIASEGKTLISGLNAYCGASENVGLISPLTGVIQLTKSTSLQLEQRESSPQGGHSFGHYNNYGEDEVYASVEITKIG